MWAQTYVIKYMNGKAKPQPDFRRKNVQTRVTALLIWMWWQSLRMCWWIKYWLSRLEVKYTSEDLKKLNLRIPDPTNKLFRSSRRLTSATRCLISTVGVFIAVCMEDSIPKYPQQFPQASIQACQWNLWAHEAVWGLCGCYSEGWVGAEWGTGIGRFMGHQRVERGLMRRGEMKGREYPGSF